MPPSALERAIRKLVDSEGSECHDDLDKEVAELIIAEAREKNKGYQWQQQEKLPDQGSRRQTTNTRFLNSVVRGVQSHNRAVLNSPGSAEAGSRQHSSLYSEGRSGSRSEREGGHKTSSQRNSGERDSDRRGTLRGWSDDEIESKREARVDKSSSTRKRQDSGSPTSRDRMSEKDRERRRRRRERRAHREEDSGQDDRHRGDDSRHSHRRDGSSRDDGTARKPTQETGEAEQKFDANSSKMDRYFEERYDPMLDVSADTREDENGLIEDDGWDRMLSVLKEKEDRKRARKERPREGKSHRREEKAPRVGVDVLDTQYTSRGKLREWDKGKDVLD